MKEHYIRETGADGEDVHVFAIQTTGVYWEANDNEKCYSISIPIGPASIEVSFFQ